MVKEGAMLANARAEVHHQRLEDAHCSIAALREDLLETGGVLRRTRAQVSEARAYIQTRDDQVSNIVGAVATLNHGLDATNGDVRDVKALLELPESSGRS